MKDLKNHKNDSGEENHNSYDCCRPQTDTTPAENEALDEQFTTGEDPETNYRQLY